MTVFSRQQKFVNLSLFSEKDIITFFKIPNKYTQAKIHAHTHTYTARQRANETQPEINENESKRERKMLKI